MGSVQFTKSRHNRSRDAEGCGNFLAKYLTKHPKSGYPDWVLDADYRIRRFSSSRGFWGGFPAPSDNELWAGREDVTAVEMEEGESVIESEKPMTIRQRIALCGNLSNVFNVIEFVNLDTGERIQREEFVCTVGHPLDAVAEAIRTFDSPHPYELVVVDPLAKLKLGKLMPSLARGSNDD